LSGQQRIKLLGFRVESGLQLVNAAFGAIGTLVRYGELFS